MRKKKGRKKEGMWIIILFKEGRPDYTYRSHSGSPGPHHRDDAAISSQEARQDAREILLRVVQDIDSRTENETESDPIKTVHTRETTA